MSMPKKILVVDDEPDILKVVIFRLKKAGYKIRNAANGREALDVIDRGEKFDLILVDLIMPVMDGYELCKAVRKSPLAAVPIIILSASAGSDIEKKIRDLKVNDYIVKPFEPEIFLAKVKAVLNRGD